MKIMVFILNEFEDYDSSLNKGVTTSRTEAEEWVKQWKILYPKSRFQGRNYDEFELELP